MHGGLENVIPSRPKRAEKHCFFKKGENLNIFRITKRIIKKIISGYYISGILCSLINAITNIFFADYKVFLEKNDLSSFNFIVLSKHIQKNLPRYIKNQNFKTSLIYLPCIFPQIISQETNSYPKFAIFGYGTDNGLFEQFLDRLKVASPTKKYEIRVISMRHYRCPEGLNVTFVGKGDFIQRCEMEKCAEDIDFFLNFYGPDTYRLSCSGSIIEAIMYDKPVIYLRNECYDSFNSITGPIGFRAEDVYSFSQIVYHIIESWPSTLEKITEFKNNIKDVKEIIDITNQLKVNPLLIL
jgi:hypothetical protein